MHIKSLIFSFFLSLHFFACAQSEEQTESKTAVTTSNLYSYQIVLPGLHFPWGITSLPNKSLLITDKLGQLFLYKNNDYTEISGLPEIKVLGQGGLMDIEAHPDYSQNGWLYLSYASDVGVGTGANTTIARAKLSNNTLTNLDVLYKATPNSKKGQHFGSRISFDADNKLYFSIGDRGSRDINPQDITQDGGKIYRLNDDGSIPIDNPFTNHKGAKKAIYSYGHRNPQGMAIHPTTGKVWTHEHGPKGGDEINIIEKGANYGWPKTTFGINYSGTSITEFTDLPGIKAPLHHWTPSIAPSGMTFVTSNVYPEWKGNLLVGSLKFQYISRCVIKNNKVVSEEILFKGIGRVRSIIQANDGYIYAGIENVGLIKIIPKK